MKTVRERRTRDREGEGDREGERESETVGQDRQREGLIDMADIFIAARGRWSQIGREIDQWEGQRGR